MSWWLPQSRYYGYDGIICDGAVRSGKTICMGLSFFLWSMGSMEGKQFALCGKTIAGVKRNLLEPLRPLLEELGFGWKEKVSENWVELSVSGRRNRYYLFSGHDAGSAGRIQGMTLGGALFDEAALQEREFVEQAAARCSVEGSRLWFNCNPEHPGHWFYTEWIQKREEKNLCYLHFRMEDNPSLSRQMRQRYERLYSGSFYKRFVLGEWCSPQGLVYPMFSREKHLVEQAPQCRRFWVSCDYGTMNPCSMGLWGESGGRWYRIREYYHDARRQGVCKTDEEYYAELERLCGDTVIEAVIIDPSAASMMECIRRHGRFRVVPAKNQVVEGIQLVSRLLQEERLKFCAGCTDSLREFSLYRWNEGLGNDQPVKENDHAMDDIRYFAMEVCRESQGGFFAVAHSRSQRKG